MKLREPTKDDIEKAVEYFKEVQKIHTDDNYRDWLLSWDFSKSGYGSIYDDDIQYSTVLTEDEINKFLLISEYEADITWRNPDYKSKYTYEDKDAYFPTIINLLYANGIWYELSTMWGQGSRTEFFPIKDFNNWEYKDKVKYYYNMIKKEWYCLVRK